MRGLMLRISAVLALGFLVLSGAWQDEGASAEGLPTLEPGGACHDFAYNSKAPNDGRSMDALASFGDPVFVFNMFRCGATLGIDMTGMGINALYEGIKMNTCSIPGYAENSAWDCSPYIDRGEAPSGSGQRSTTPGCAGVYAGACSFTPEGVILRPGESVTITPPERHDDHHGCVPHYENTCRGSSEVRPIFGICEEGVISPCNGNWPPRDDREEEDDDDDQPQGDRTCQVRQGVRICIIRR
jgi:hypothetical protein